jgi:tetratricopeptide (TPR) repeat protein
MRAMNKACGRSKFHWWLILAVCAWLGGRVGAMGVTTPVTPAESDAFGRQLEKHFNHNDRMFYVNAFDSEGLMKKALPEELHNDPVMADFQTGFRRGLELQLQLPKSIKFLRTTEMDGQPCVLMRVLTTNGAVNYLDLFVEHGAGGGISINDMYVYMTAEKLSDTTRRLIIPLVQEKNKSLLDRAFGETPDLIKYGPQWQNLIYLVQKGRYQEALDVYDQLPETLKQQKFILVQELRAAQNVNQADYLATLRLWRKTYPNDASLDLLSIDYFLLLKQYDRALECVERLDKALGGDPYQDFNRAAIYSLLKDETNAEKFAVQAFTREPDLSRAGIFAVNLMRDRHDYSACVQMLERMQSLGGYSMTSLDRALRTSPANAGLLQSDAYQKWFFAVPQELPPASPDKPTN